MREYCLTDEHIIGDTSDKGQDTSLRVEDIADMRESPALSILTILEQKQALVTYHDPYIPYLESDGRVLESIRLDSQLLSSQDCIIIVTNHSCFDYEFISKHSPLIFDTRDATHGLQQRYSHIHIL